MTAAIEFTGSTSSKWRLHFDPDIVGGWSISAATPTPKRCRSVQTSNIPVGIPEPRCLHLLLLPETLGATVLDIGTVASGRAEG